MSTSSGLIVSIASISAARVSSPVSTSSTARVPLGTPSTDGKGSPGWSRQGGAWRGWQGAAWRG